jgi:hypothetical protein
MKVSWWSGGITSAVACLLEPESSIMYIETGSHHPDNLRFMRDCEAWYGRSIETLQNSKYSDHFDVVQKTRYVNGPPGARCTAELKRRVREEWEKKQTEPLIYVWGFEYGEKEQNRAKRIIQTVPKAQHVFPLIEAKITKQDAIRMVQEAGIEVPMMYRLGFHNANCIGCVKGGAAYWNLVRQHFPGHFHRMAQIEREIGRSCLKKCFLDELDPNDGRGKPPFVMDCGAIGEGCEIQRSREYIGRE